MSEQQRDGEARQDEERRGPKEKVSDGIRQGLGVLSAFKDALDETINEARERGDLSADRAKAAMKDALTRAQEAAEEARERLDFVTQKDFDTLKGAVDTLKTRIDELDARIRGAGEAGSQGSDTSASGGDGPTA